MKNLYQFKNNEGWYSSIYQNFEQCDAVARAFASGTGQRIHIIKYRFSSWRKAWVVEEEIKTYQF